MDKNILQKFRDKLLVPIRLVPKNGLSAEKLAFSIAIGIVAGLFPVIGATTVVSLLLTWIFKQNILVVQSVQWALALVQVLLIVPFIRLGAFILQVPRCSISIEQINLAFKPGVLEGIKAIGVLQLYGIFTWLLIAVPLGAICYFSALKIFKKKNQSI